MSQSSVSDLTTEVSVSAIIRDSEDMSNYFIVVENPRGQKCIYCKESWKTLTATTKKAHLSNQKYSNIYKIKLCALVPPDVSTSMINKLREVEEKQIKKSKFNDRVSEEMSFPTTQQS